MQIKNKHIAIIVGVLILLATIFYFASSRGKINVYADNMKTENSLENNLDNKKELRILVAGDIMPDRHIRGQINKYHTAENFVSTYLGNMKEVNSEYDYVMANLEGPITENKSKTLRSDGSYGKDLIFTFPTSSVQILKLLNIKVVSLANNHTDNFFRKGYEDTKKFLKKENIKYFGNPYNEKENLSEVFCEKEICIAYIGYHQFTTNNSGEIISEEIKRVKENNLSDFTIVMPHWGIEYEKLSSQKQKDLARGWIDVGADMVIGAHPHVRQEVEIYKDKHIYYSLGNYIFDQWFSSEVKTGKVLDITFSKYKNEDGVEQKEIKLNDNKEVNITKELIKYR